MAAKGDASVGLTKDDKHARWAAALVPVGVSLAVFGFTLVLFKPTFTGSLGEVWTGIAKVVISALLAGLAGLLSQKLMSPLAGSPFGEAGSDTSIRNRIALLVLIWGSLAIFGLTLAIMVCFAFLAMQPENILPNNPIPGKVDTLITGAFGAVLPILATWVGTVIAFYFTNVAYRTAAEATQVAVLGVTAPGKRVRDIMTPYAKIAKMEVNRKDVRDVRIADIVKLMDPPATRLVLFETQTRAPLLIIRRDLIPNEWVTEEPGTRRLVMTQDHLEKTVHDYLQALADANDAATFALVAPAASLAEAATQMRAENARDVFVTAIGQKSDTLGWLSDDRIAAG